MKFSEQWLREWVDPAVSTAELAAQLTMAGLEVDGVEPAAPAFTNVVVGEVLSVAPHPQADRLRVCRVHVGEAESLTIVCGAANVRTGMRVPTAKVGAVLPGGLEIKRAKLRGVESSGMLCSAKELGLAETSEGLLDLPGDAAVGLSVRDFLRLDDAVIEVDFTPNRGDCLSVLGLAREVGVINQCTLTAPKIVPVEPTIDTAVAVEVNAPADCPRYLGRVIKGLNPHAITPMWMKERLRRSGIRSLGPLVDVTNYVLLEMGQPMHAFDLRRLEGGIVVRRARPGESLTLLDGKTLTLADDVLVIADRTKPLALAGIMGGQQSGIADDTTDVVLESAFFTPDIVRGRGRRYGLQTDSSYRFERGVDPREQRRATERATALLLEIAGGRAGPVVEAVSAPFVPAHAAIALRQARLTRVLGVEIPPEQVEDMLRRLGMDVVRDGTTWRVVPPSFRFDIAIEADLVEEIGRIYGYSRLPEELPRGALNMHPRPEARLPLSRLRRVLVDRGYREAITYSFVDPHIQKVLDPERNALALANPISSEMSVMRTTLWAGLLKAVSHNLNRQQERVRLFETGLRFLPDANGMQQRMCVAGVMVGAADPEQWGATKRAADFFDIKGDVEAVLGLTGCGAEFIFSSARHPALHPGQSARISRGRDEVGWVGALHPAVVEALELQQNVLVFEFSLDALEPGAIPRFQGLSKFPSIRRDLAIVVDDSVPAAAVSACVRSAAGELLQELRLFDVYRGKGIAAGQKSLALGITLQDYKRTLTDDEVEAVVQGVLDALKTQVRASLRE